jgi:hypothetical protein
MNGFEYPPGPHERRHGPGGYRHYRTYREWLRDEFSFRCVYCLRREQWIERSATFHVEHSIPVSVRPDLRCVYSNLLYACARCNEAKRGLTGVPDPCKVDFRACLRVQSSGEVQALNLDGKRLVEVLRLNSADSVSFRGRWLRVLSTLKAADLVLYNEVMGFPDELPDLRPPRRRVPFNEKPEGASNCYFVLRQRGELPDRY